MYQYCTISFCLYSLSLDNTAPFGALMPFTLSPCSLLVPPFPAAPRGPAGLSVLVHEAQLHSSSPAFLPPPRDGLISNLIPV